MRRIRSVQPPRRLIVLTCGNATKAIDVLEIESIAGNESGSAVLLRSPNGIILMRVNESEHQIKEMIQALGVA